ncbi:DUF465 domain-containing protein [Escherichia coli]|uniref:DUF465 domain-containing protein n=1 Tax=Escherichia coli TaxID=562 RepID=UPI002AF6BD63|nr:DUF465 domain-containing protein [Escherichia coli]MEA1172912.1 DUF465 domain-containing protein [Escherichia coli]
MFPEYRELISALKGNHKRFDSLFEKHNKLDHEIKRIEDEFGSAYLTKVVRLKLEKLEIKREIQKILEDESEKGER